MSTYLVTGAAGFIASKVCEQLLEAGHAVVGIDNLNDYYDVRLKDYRLSRLLDVRCSLLEGDPKKSAFAHNKEPLTHNRFEFRVLDIENLPALEEVFKAHKFEAVFNLAARAGVRYSLEFPELYRRTNILGEENVLKCQVKYGVKKHVLASSSSVYAGCPMPFVEDAVLGKMQSPYAETKRAAELLAKDYHEKHGLDVTVLRYFTVFGPAGRPDMAPFRFIKWIDEGTPITLYGDGSQARDFTYIDDIARGTVLAGQLFGGKLSVPKAESGKLKAEVSESKSGSEPKPSAFSFQPSAFIEGGLPPSFEVINLGGGKNPLTIAAMIGIIEDALSAQRALKADTGKLRAEGFGKIPETESDPQLSASSPQLSVKAIINRLPSSPADMQATWADISKAKRLLGWSPQITPHEGFMDAVTWHLKNKTWLKDVKV